MSKKTRDHQQYEELKVLRQGMSFTHFLIVAVIIIIISGGLAIVIISQTSKTIPLVYWLFTGALILLFFGNTLYSDYDPLQINGSSQKYHSRRRGKRQLFHLLLGLPLLTILVWLTFYEYQLIYVEQTPEVSHGVLFFGVSIWTVAGIVFFFRKFLPAIRVLSAGAHFGPITANFDREAYQPGDQVFVNFKEKNHTSQNLTRWVTLRRIRDYSYEIGGYDHDDHSSTAYEREIYFEKSAEYTVKELTAGISLQLPETMDGHLMKTDMTGSSEKLYWELVVEVPNSYQWSRFFVTVEDGQQNAPQEKSIALESNISHLFSIDEEISTPTELTPTTAFSSVGLDKNQRQYLKLNSAGFWGQLFIILFFGLPSLATGIFIPNIKGTGIESFPPALFLAAAIPFFLGAWITGFSMAFMFNPIILKGQTQHFRFTRRLSWNIYCALICLPVVVSILILAYCALFHWNDPSVWPDPKDVKSDGPIAAVMFMIALLCLGLLAIGRVIFRNLWRQIKRSLHFGTTIAEFDRDTYKPGDTVKVRISDKSALNPNRQYGVHFQFIDEKLGGRGGNRGRFTIYHTQKEISGIDLHRGIQLLLPNEVTGYDLNTNMRNGNKPRYWEILVEEKNGYHWSRFLIEVRSDG